MRLRFTLLIATVVVILATTTVVVLEYSTRVSLPTPKQGDEIILAAGSNFTLGPNMRTSLVVSNLLIHLSTSSAQLTPGHQPKECVSFLLRPATIHGTS